MAGFRNMVDMTLSPEEKAEERMRDIYPAPLADMPDVPPGLCIALTETELEKLDIDTDDCDVGDMIHVSGMARLTSKSINDSESGTRMRFELAFVFLSVEDENREYEDDDDEEEEDGE
jgi:hypothetical protein